MIVEQKAKYTAYHAVLWIKPSKNQFSVKDREGRSYLPDFVIETKTEKIILETKAKDEITDDEVVRKAETTTLWCYIATEFYAKPNGEKPWRYALVPHDAVQSNSTMHGLLSRFTRAADMDLMGRYEMGAG